MWESQSEQYWKEREAIKNKDRRRKVQLAGILVLLLFCCSLGWYLGERRKQAALVAAAALVAPDRKAACVAQALDEGRWAAHECVKVCAFARVVDGSGGGGDPRGPHYACTVGCERAGAAAVDVGCAAPLPAAACARRVAAACGLDADHKHCSSLLAAEGGLQSTCRRGCEAMATAACERATAIQGSAHHGEL